jgi:dTDP-4-amino-4,6-dideoxygalactose transaminase
MAIVRRHGIVVVEDMTQAFEAVYNGKMIGTIKIEVNIIEEQWHVQLS